MLVVWSVTTAVLLLVTARTALVSRRPSWRRARLEGVALRAALPVDPGLVPEPLLDRVGARVARRVLAARAGALAGALVILLLVLTGSEADRRGVTVDRGAGDGVAVLVSSSTLLSLLAVVGGSLLVVLLATGREALAAPASPGPRLARTSAPRLEHYVPRLETGVVRAVVLLPLLALVVGAAVRLTRGGDLAPLALPAVVVAASVAVWAAVEVLCRRLLAQPRPAASALELAWDDVLRAQLLRELGQVPVLLGAAAGFVVVVRLLEPASGAEGTAALLGVAGLAAVLGVGLLAVAASVVARPPERYVRARLWPLPADPEGADPALAPVVLR